MHWKTSIIVAMLALTAVGCAPAQEQGTMESPWNATGMQSTNPSAYQQNSIYKEGQKLRNYGYVEYNKRDMSSQQAGTFYVDRDVLARSVATVVTSTPGVEDAQVLVTDEDLYIGIPGVEDTATLNRVMLSAWSITPRWFKISITDDHQTISSMKQMVNQQKIDHIQLEQLFKTHGFDMTGMNVEDNGQNQTQINLNERHPNTNGMHQETYK
jgi:hypothetical protein